MLSPRALPSTICARMKRGRETVCERSHASNSARFESLTSTPRVLTPVLLRRTNPYFQRRDTRKSTSQPVSATPGAGSLSRLARAEAGLQTLAAERVLFSRD